MRSPTLNGAYLTCSGIFMALMAVLAWIPAVFFGCHVDLSIVLVYAAWDWVPALSLSAIGVLLLWVAMTAVAAFRRKLSPDAG
jgi:hypothetical protein